MMVFERFINIILFTGLMFVATISKAACPLSSTMRGDSVVARDSRDKNVSARKGYDVFKYSMQSRFRYPDAMKFSNSSLLSHLYWGAALSYDKIAPQKDFELSSATSYGFVIGKDISKTHSLSLQMLYGSYLQKANALHVEFTKLSWLLNHHFNFSRYYFGHNPYRVFELSSTMGLGFQNYEMRNKSESSFYALFGLKGAFRIGNNLILSVDPHVAVADKSYDIVFLLSR